jgi:hypothetical protein
MRPKLYCHLVGTDDDGNRLILMSNSSDEDAFVEVRIRAPFESFEVDEEPRQWFEYRLKLERIDEKE